MTETEYINLKTLSKRLNCSQRTLRGWIADPNIVLPAYKVRGKLLFCWGEVVRWIEKFRLKPVDLDAMVNKIIYESGKGRSKNEKGKN